MGQILVLSVNVISPLAVTITTVLVLQHTMYIDKANMYNTVFAKFWNTAEPPLRKTAYLGNYYDTLYDKSTLL